jgi:rSAM/selenodomain-associated transferase 2
VCGALELDLATGASTSMLSVVIPTLNAEHGLGRTFAALLPGMVEGVVREVIVVDGGSTDATLAIADAAGVEVIRSEPGRGRQLMAGADQARHSWMLFLHADTVLGDGWQQEARRFMMSVNSGERRQSAAAFKFALDDVGLKPRIWEHAVAARCAVFKLPYGDQGLLISQAHYRRIGGYRPMPLMEDVDIVRRLGAGAMTTLETPALTNAVRFRRDGYTVRSARNLACLAMYYAKFSPDKIDRYYQSQSP